MRSQGEGALLRAATSVWVASDVALLELRGKSKCEGHAEMDKDWSLASEQPDQRRNSLPDTTSRRPTKNEHLLPARAPESRVGPLIEMLKGMMGKAEKHYMMISGQLDHLGLALEAQRVGAICRPGGLHRQSTY